MAEPRCVSGNTTSLSVTSHHGQAHGHGQGRLAVPQSTDGQASRWLRTKRTGRATLTSIKEHIKNPRLAQDFPSSLLPAWLQPYRTYDINESFFPYPKITFLVDRPRGLTCQICRDSRHHLEPWRLDCTTTNKNTTTTSSRRRAGGSNGGDSTFSILPCGHVAGSKCLATWCKSHHDCPFCRLPLWYKTCRHPVPPRPITSESVHILPRTLAEQGEIPDLCQKCHGEKLWKEARKGYEATVRRFQEARRRFYITRIVADREELDRRREELETSVMNRVMMGQADRWLDSW